MVCCKQVPSFHVSDKIGDFLGAYLFDGPERSFLLNSSIGCSALVSRAFAEDIVQQKISEPLAFDLIQRGLIAHPSGMKPLTEERVLPCFFIFDLTQQCNFRCVYCFRHLKEISPTISDENLDAIVNFIVDYCKKNNLKEFAIQPWGGEPLIAFEKIMRIDDKFKAAGLHPLISIETNASLITDSIAREASQRNIRIGVSVDGMPEAHNLHRKMINGRPSFENVRRGVDILRQYDNLKDFGVVCVLTSHTFPFLSDIVEFFGADLKVKCFKLNLVKDNPVMKDASLCLTEEQVIQAQNILVDKLIDLNDRGFEITELNVHEKLKNLLVRSKSNICTSRGCMGGRKMIAFDQDGRIFPCDVTDYKEESIGDVKQGGDLIEMVKAAMSSRRDFFNKKHSADCDNCPFWFFCKGGCTTAIKYKLGRVDGVDHQECKANLALYPRLIDIILNNPKKVLGLTRGSVRLD